MECEYFNNQLSAYVDGLLNAKESSRVEMHVQHCHRCAKDLQELQKVKALLRTLPEPEADAFFWPSVYSRVRQHRVRNHYKPVAHLIAPHVAWSTLVAILLVGFVTLTPSRINIANNPVPTLDPDTLITLHATSRVVTPLADSGELRTIFMDTNDWNQINQTSQP